jgi:hypothetical protein
MSLRSKAERVGVRLTIGLNVAVKSYCPATASTSTAVETSSHSRSVEAFVQRCSPKKPATTIITTTTPMM